eukprot:GFUD01028942.1.p1 GENE.GFUD01028942.1~~GFUD01028942.1.p1  ORF type:complete len:217 (+),score=45.72 GFUD01028942.1:90-740(+)
MSAHLRWEESNRVLGKELENIWKAGEMIDVTLVCEDRKQISAHKVVLAAYSTFFRDIFNNNPHPKPLIFLKGITHDYLLRILNFLYTGEARVSQNNLKEFLEVAEDLKKGLIEEKKPSVTLADKTNTWSHTDTYECEQDRIKNEVPENTEDEENLAVEDRTWPQRNTSENPVEVTSDNIQSDNETRVIIDAENNCTKPVNFAVEVRSCESDAIIPD